MPKRKYSKSSKFYFSAKQNFFEKNDEMLDEIRRKNAIYAEQRKREACKICGLQLDQNIDFKSHKISYVFCNDCLHLNGVYDDTEEFCNKLYISEGGVNYGKNYIDGNYLQNCEDIYLPKVEFLKGNFSHLDKAAISVLDVGCGAGHFVYSALESDIDAVGIDVNAQLVDFGNSKIDFLSNVKPLKIVDEDDFYNEIIKTSALIISAIGVIEHLREPSRFFEAFQKSKAQYLYYSVPMFSFSVMLENCLPNFFPRQLSGGHTHLFTEESIERMNCLIGIHPVAEWRFGSDAMDLYRAMQVTLKQNRASEKTLRLLQKNFEPIIDTIQKPFDESHFCSEIHLLGSKGLQI